MLHLSLSGSLSRAFRQAAVRLRSIKHMRTHAACRMVASFKPAQSLGVPPQSRLEHWH